MYVKELWLYPVKSLGGELVSEISVGEMGFQGDRLVHVERGNGHVVTARTHPKLLGLKGTLDEKGQPLINGMRYDTPQPLVLVRRAAGADVNLVYYDGPERFDVLPLSVATDGAIEHMKLDRRRLRPNIIIGGVNGLTERTWPGHHLQIGSLTIFANRLRRRCVMTTWDPDTQAQDISVLKRIASELDGSMSLDCSIAMPGVIREGDEVKLLD